MSTIPDSGAVRPDPPETDTAECQSLAEVVSLTIIRTGPQSEVSVRPGGSGCVLKAIGGRRVAASVHLRPGTPDEPGTLDQLIDALTEMRASLAVTA